MGRLEASWVLRTSIDASCTGERVTAIRAEFINNRNFALVATGVAMATLREASISLLMSKLLILFGEFGRRTRTRTLDPLIKSQGTSTIRRQQIRHFDRCCGQCSQNDRNRATCDRGHHSFCESGILILRALTYVDAALVRITSGPSKE
jgi:hypothetical protein